MRDPTTIFRGSPARVNRPAVETPSPYTHSNNLFNEITSLRMRLRDLEDDTKSSVVGGIDEQDSLSPNMIRKDIAKLEQEKANLEKDFLNQMSSLATENQKRIVELQTKLAESEARNHELECKLRSANEQPTDSQQIDDEKERLLRIIEEQRDSHVREIEQMKQNLASTDMEITESRGEIDHLHEQLEELQTHRETLIEEVTSCRMELSDEQRRLAAMKTEFTKTKLTVEKLQTEIKHKDEKIKQKDTELSKLNRTSDDLKTTKKDLEEAQKKNKVLENEIKEKDGLLKQQRDEIAEMNDSIIHLQDHKEMLMLEVTDLRMELQKRADSGVTSTSANTKDGDDQPISSSEKRKLESELNKLGERLVAFQTKITEKESQINRLSNLLKDERKTNDKLKIQLRTVESSAIKVQDDSPRVKEKDSQSEILLLRKQNKTLSDEIKTLRKLGGNGVSPTASSTQQFASSSLDLRPVEQRNKIRTPSSLNNKHNSSFSSVKDPDESSVSSQRQIPTAKNQANTGLTVTIPTSLTEPASMGKTPRTPVSGLVASFEKIIANKKPSLDESPIPSLNAGLDLIDIKREFENEKSVTKELEKQLKRERDIVNQLKEKLRDVNADSSRSLQSTSSSDLFKKLEQSQREIRKLQAKVTELEEAKKKNLEELDLLRSEIVYNDVERSDMEKKVHCFETERNRLRGELEKATQRHAFEDEKKGEEVSNEIRYLENKIKERDEKLSHLQLQLQHEEETNDEKNFRLRAQLLKKEEECKEIFESLSKEIELKNVQITRLQSEIDDNSNNLEKSCSSLRMQIDSLEGQLEDALNMVNDRDEKIDSLEADLASLVRQTSNAAVEKENEIHLLATQLSDLKTKNKEIEEEYTKSIKDLEDKIFSLELKLADLETEKENLKTSLEAAEYKIQNEISPDLQKKVDEEREALTLELTKTQMNYADLEMQHASRVKELEGQIKNLETKVQAEMLEKDAARTALDEYVKQSEVEASPKIQRVHDSEINRITVELTKTQIKQADLEREYSNRVKDLEMEIEELEAEAEEELKQKDKEIDELKRNLELKEDEVRRLENERSHLCASMNDMSFSRNDEVHELQAEIIDLSTKMKAQEREIQSLKMKLQDYDNRVDDSSQKYSQRVKDLEEELNDMKLKSKTLIDPETVSAVKSENSKLRECVRELKMERRSLNERLEVLMSERNGSKSTQILQKRNQVLKEEVEKLTKRLKKLEASITRFAI